MLRGMNAASLIQYEHAGALYSFTREAWFNAIGVAARFGKRPVDWLRLPAAKSYMAAQAKALPGFPCKAGKSHFGLVRIKRGGASPGTGFHPKLALARGGCQCHRNTGGSTP